MSDLDFWVAGVPRAQGSKRHVGKGVMVEMSKELPAWRQDIAATARAAAGNEPQMLGPLRLRACFWFPRPASHFGTGRNMGQLKASAPRYVATNPDLDKLMRALGDALSASGVIRDDRQLAWVEIDKRYGGPGVEVHLSRITE